MTWTNLPNFPSQEEIERTGVFKRPTLNRSDTPPRAHAWILPTARHLRQPKLGTSDEKRRVTSRLE